MAVTIPDSPTALAAADFARVAAPQFLLNHSYRTYLFGMSAVTDDVDREAAFVAAMIHDLGLTDRHRGTDEFAVVGADLAAKILTEHGWELDRILLVEQAILRHTNLIPEDDPTHRVVQVGAQIDVAGFGAESIDRENLVAVLKHYPRLDFVPRMRTVFLDEAHRHPAGVFAQLENTVTLSERLSTNPIDLEELV
ncbi:HD domain-containing protein [Rhodococcus sp. BE178]|uniref:HD domain-containing protein n=1 Tax=Rhodococcus sp. BE178 TaxID=2817737 RepID=UPI003D1AF6B3